MAGEFQKELRVPTGGPPAVVTETEAAGVQAPRSFRQDRRVYTRPARPFCEVQAASRSLGFPCRRIPSVGPQGPASVLHTGVSWRASLRAQSHSCKAV